MSTSTPKRRHPVRRVVIAIIVVVVLVIAFFVADAFARSYATNYVREQVASSLGLSSDAPVSANLGSGSILLQAATGHLNSVDVRIDPLTVAGLSGSAHMTATDVPLDQTQPAKSVDLSVTVPASTVTKGVSEIETLKAFTPTVKIVDGKVDIVATATFFGIRIPIGLVVVPGVKAGHPTFTVSSVKASGATISVSTLDRYIPGIKNVLSTGSSLCIANALPKAFELTGVSLTSTSLVYTLSAQNVALNSTALSHKGSCS
jgi:hypothetical protein